IRDAHANAMPGRLVSGALRATRSPMADHVTYAANARKLTPTMRSVSRSRRSRWHASASTAIRQSSAAPELTSMKLSTPNPTSEILPPSAPAPTATRPSRLFQPIVKYSRRRPRPASAARSIAIDSASALGPDVLEIDRQVVDSAPRRGDVVGEFAGLV